jgi:hypothetical protein
MRVPQRLQYLGAVNGTTLRLRALQDGQVRVTKTHRRSASKMRMTVESVPTAR